MKKKTRLITQLWSQTEQAKKRDEIETFRQKEEIKANIEQQEQDSLAQTGLSLKQNVTLGKITNNFGVKPDDLVWKAVAWNDKRMKIRTRNK